MREDIPASAASAASSASSASSASPTSLAALGRIGFVGVGAAGSTVARALADCGATIAAIASRHPERAEALAAVLPGQPSIVSPQDVVAASDLVFLAVPDDAIGTLAASLPWMAGQAALHLSGAQGAGALEAAAARGASVAALHPLMTFTRAPFPVSAEEALARLRGCVWALEARDDALARSLEGLVAALGGRVVRIGAADRVPYHIAAVLASNYVATLLGAAVSLWGDFEMPAEGALQALLPLLRATVDNLEAVGLPAALTGPIARGDEGTLAAHLAWLDAYAGDGASHTRAALRDAYVALARIALPLAEAKGTLAPETAARLRALLAEHER